MSKSSKVLLSPDDHHRFVSLLAAKKDTAQSVLAQAIADYLAVADDPPGQPPPIDEGGWGELERMEGLASVGLERIVELEGDMIDTGDPENGETPLPWDMGKLLVETLATGRHGKDPGVIGLCGALRYALQGWPAWPAVEKR